MTAREATAATAPRHLVFTDVDETLISGKSLLDFLGWYFTDRYGRAGARRARALLAQLAERSAGGLPREQANRSYYRFWRGEPAAAVAAGGRRWFAERCAAGGFFRPGIREVLARHQASGAAVALVSGSFPAVLDPIAQAVGAAHVLCSRPRTRQGRYDGALVGEPMIGAAKGRAVRALLGRHPHIDPADCAGYGDHVSDLPMLAEVGHPVVVGGSAELARLLPHAARLA